MNAEIISAIRAHPVLYKSVKSKSCNEKERKECWKRIATQFRGQNAKMLEDMWLQTIDEYIEFLRQGGDFPLQKEMQFMQQHLFNNGALQIDLEDEGLIEYLCSDIEYIPQVKKPKHDAKIPMPVVIHKYQKSTTTAPCRNCGCQNESKDCNIQPGPISGVSSSQTSQEHQHLFGSNVNNFSSTELIFLGYAKTLQQMPSYLQWQTKQQISEIINAAELKSINMEKLKTNTDCK